MHFYTSQLCSKLNLSHLNFSHAEKVKKGLSKLWQQEPVTFENFAIVSSEELIHLVDKMPAKFAEKSQFLESQANKAAKSIEIRGIEASEEATLLHLKSGDNDKAAVLSEYIKMKYKRSLDMVRNILFTSKNLLSTLM